MEIKFQLPESYDNDPEDYFRSGLYAILYVNLAALDKDHSEHPRHYIDFRELEDAKKSDFDEIVAAGIAIRVPMRCLDEKTPGFDSGTHRKAWLSGKGDRGNSHCHL